MKYITKLFSPLVKLKPFSRPHLSFLVPEKLPCVFYHLLVGELGVWLLLAEVQDLPQRHGVGPDVTRRGELTLHKRRCCVVHGSTQL